MIFHGAEEILSWLKAYVWQRYEVRLEGNQVALSDLGVDSVELPGMLCALEEWLGRPVPVDFFADVVDVQQIVDKLVRLQDDDAASDPVQPPYKAYLNPYVGAKLEQLKIDRTFVRGEGCYLYDGDGHRYIDFMAQYGALPFGHHPKEIWDAITQLREDAEPNFAQPSILASAGVLARRLIDLAPPGLRYATFANSGAEAIEAALKMVRHATARMGILSTWEGFHGKTFGALSATGKAEYQSHFGLPLPGFEYVHYGNIEELERTLSAKPDFFAAFIVEPIHGEGGVRVPPPGYLRAVKEVCRRFGTLLIVDEVQTGLGRTGEMFACQADQVEPDVLVLAKALGGGLVPIGACLCTEAAYSEKFALKHSSTFSGNALAARAALATLEMLTRDDGALLRQVRENGAYLKRRLEAMRDQYPWLVREIGGRGLMLGIRIEAARTRWNENFLGMAAQEKELAQFVSSYLLNVERIRLAPTLNRGEVLRVQPPLIATREQCEEVADGIAHAFDVLAHGHTGLFYRAILKRERPVLPSAPPVHVSVEPQAHEDGNRFAFLLHPIDERSYADYDAGLQVLQPNELREFAASLEGLLEPVIGSTVTIRSKTGATAVGDFIMISYTAEQMRRLPQQQALKILRSGLDVARRRGARIVGLGAFTSVISGGGSLLADFGLPLTSGNSYTVVAGIQAIDMALSRRYRGAGAPSAAIVGAAGAIGSCMTMLLAERVSQLALIGNPAHAPDVGRAKLVETARHLARYLRGRALDGHQFRPETFAGALVDALGATDDIDRALSVLERNGALLLAKNAFAVSLAEVVVTATSFPGKVVEDDSFRPGAIVCDISRPRSVAESIVASRPDVLVIDGGIVAVPGRPYVGPYGLQRGTAYACMAETMVLALEGRFEHTSLGATLRVEEVLRQQELARDLGFELAGLQSFGRPLDETALASQRYRDAAPMRRSISVQ